MTDHHKLTLSENFTPDEGLIPEFPLIPAKGEASGLGLRTGIVSLHPIGNLGGLLPGRMAVRLIPPGQTSSGILYSTTKEDAIALAQAIICFFAPHLLATNPPAVIRTPPPPPPPPNPMVQFAPGPHRIQAMTPDCLPGAYVNVLLNGCAPTVCFGGSGYALKEANRIAEKTPAPATVITARIEHVHKSEVKITSYGGK
jgi:hypothetical protein